MKNLLKKPTESKALTRVSKVLFFSFLFGAVGTALFLIISYPKMKEFKKNWLTLECVWDDKEFKGQYVGKMGILKTPGGTFNCKEKDGIVDCFIENYAEFYGKGIAPFEVYLEFDRKKEESPLSFVIKFYGFSADEAEGFCAQADAVYDPKRNICVRKVGFCRIKEVGF